jgi:hypothetical protein
MEIPLWQESNTDGSITATCVDCYAYVDATFTIVIELGWFKINRFDVSLKVPAEVKASVKVLVSAQAQRDWEKKVLDKYNIASVTFWLGMIPIRLSTLLTSTNNF